MPKGPLWCNANSLLNTRMDSLIRMQQSDFCMRREVGSFGEEPFGYNCNPGQNLLKNLLFLIVPSRAQAGTTGSIC